MKIPGKRSELDYFKTFSQIHLICRKEQNNKILLTGGIDKQEVDSKSIKIIGKIVKLERKI